MKSLILLLFVFMYATVTYSSNTITEIPSFFSDNMVLQQKSNVSIWGKAAPNAEIKITAGWGETTSAKVSEDSLWSVKLKTPKAGGPFDVKVQIADTIITYKNVVVGEVWICSGQSNMEMPLSGWPPNDTIMNSKTEIANANYPQLRFFTLPKRISTEPEFNCSGEWKVCTPAAAPEFSASAFFFGKKLHKELNIPIGLIVTSWGGTPVEGWTSGDYISQIEGYQHIVTQVSNSKTEVVKLREWLSSFPKIDVSSISLKDKWKGHNFNDEDCPSPSYNDAKWKEMNLPVLWENTNIGGFDGVVWFRKTVEIPAEWIGKELVVELGPIDDVDITFVNGQKIGGYEEDGFYSQKRVYDIPKVIVENSTLTIAVRVLDMRGGGGIWGNPEEMKIHPKDGSETISIAGNWKYLPVAEFENTTFYVFGASGEAYFNRPKVTLSFDPNTPSLLYNGMIAPLVGYGIKGAIWYQGEANVINAEKYDTLFPLMIKNWRDNWGIGDFPFYYVQIAPYDYGTYSRSYRVREAQLKTLSVPNTGMAVTMDIGNVRNIHPANKLDVGNRLALWALAKDYKKKVTYSGPIYKKMKIDGDKVHLYFDQTDGGLMLRNNQVTSNFQICGEDSLFRDAQVNVLKNEVIVYNPSVKKPVAVRYAWSNTAEATLFNGKGLPASSFRTDNWNNK